MSTAARTEPHAGHDTEFAQAARVLADRLASLAVAGPDGTPTWSGDDVDPSSPHVARLVHGTLDDGLLTGRAGIALALSTAAGLPGGRASWAELAVATAAATLRGPLTPPGNPAAPPGSAGWQSGALGVAHAVRVVARQQRLPGLEAAARAMATRAVVALAQRPDLVPPYPDLLDGAAGHLLAVLAADVEPAAQGLREQVAGGLVTGLTEVAHTDGLGASWQMAGVMDPVCGLAHGGSGVALALTEAVARGTAGPAAEELARDAVRWEAAFHRPDRLGWPDLRVEEHPPALAWCHGCLGIGISAARRHRLTGDAGSAVALGRALRAAAFHTAATDGPFDATLCHGLAGAVELHLVAAEQLAATGAAGTAPAEHLRDARLAARRITRAGRDGAPGWTCGLPSGGLTPCVLTGVAGVLLTLARCHDPAVVPSLALPGPAATEDRQPSATGGATAPHPAAG